MTDIDIDIICADDGLYIYEIYIYGKVPVAACGVGGRRSRRDHGWLDGEADRERDGGVSAAPEPCNCATARS